MSLPTSGWEEEDFAGNFSVQWITTSAGISNFGCIASRTIAKHTLIHKERLALQGQDIWTALDRHQSGEHQSQQDDDAYLQTLLSPYQRQQLWRLHDQRYTPARLVGIIYSNAFSNSELGNEPCLFVGVTSRFNHSCRPNMGMDFSGYDIRLFTTRDVPQGEELYLAYNNVVYYHSSKVRQIYLKHKCHFECQCIVCGIKNEESDRRRRHLCLLARQLAKQGAAFLYNKDFERKVWEVAKEDDQEEEYLSPCQDSKDERLFLERLIQYLALLEVEGIDHDILQCLEQVYDLTISCNLGSNKGTGPSILEKYDPAEWARLTLALYELQKGPNHTCTKTFRLKVRSQNIAFG